MITSYIYELDKNQTCREQEEENEIETLERRKPVLHSGRLLINHGYLEDSIKTKNKDFLDNDTIKAILNKVWYGEEGLFIFSDNQIARNSIYYSILVTPQICIMFKLVHLTLFNIDTG